MEAHDDSRELGRQLERVNAFSDGIFTIAATLLVLSIDLPTGPASELSEQLDDLIEPVTVYFLSFAVIGLFWTRHHRLFGRLRYSDGRFAAINLAFLSFVALLPAPTELLGRYGSDTAPTVIYAVNIVVLAALLQALVLYAERHGLADTHLVTRAGRIRGIAVMAVFISSIPVAFVNANAAVWLWVLAAILPRLIALRAS